MKPENEIKPYSYDTHTSEEWAEFLTKMHAGDCIAIDESMFDYFLEVLPPIFMNKTCKVGDRTLRVDFGFAEGAEPITYFWSSPDSGFGDGKTRYFCQRSKIMNPHA